MSERTIGNKVATVVLFLGLLLMGTTCVLIQPAVAHPWAITQCSDNIIYEEAVFLESWLDEGRVVYWAEAYDTNGDGIRDVVTLSHVVRLDEKEDGTLHWYHDPRPVYWLVDRNYDNIPDEVYIDINGLGDCHDIKFYKDLRIPGALSPDLDNKGDATI